MFEIRSIAQQEESSRTSITSITFQGHSRLGILFFKFKDFPGFSTTVGTLLRVPQQCEIEQVCMMNRFNSNTWYKLIQTTTLYILTLYIQLFYRYKWSLVILIYNIYNDLIPPTKYNHRSKNKLVEPRFNTNFMKHSILYTEVQFYGRTIFVLEWR